MEINSLSELPKPKKEGEVEAKSYGYVFGHLQHAPVKVLGTCTISGLRGGGGRGGAGEVAGLAGRSWRQGLGAGLSSSDWD